MISSPKTNVEKLLWCYQFGLAWNRGSRYANLRNLDSGRILKMNGDEADAKLLIASWQDFEPNVNRFVVAYHGREVIPDGNWGPASEAAVNMRRCAMTDFAPPAGAELSFWEDDGLRGALESYQRYAAFQNNDAEYVGGSGSWPKGCDPTKPNVHSKRVNVTTSGASAHQKAQLDEVLGAVERCEAEMGLAVRHVKDGDPKQAEVDVRFQYIAGGVIGWCEFPRPDTCNQVINCRIDNSFNVGPKTQAELNTHEYDGHGDGAEHKNRTVAKKSIMHPSISTPDDWPTWINDATESQKRRWFGGEPINKPLPPPDPTPDTTIWTGKLEAGEYVLGRKGGGTDPIIV